MAVNINVPSQVRTFANLAAFPASGALKTIYIAEDTNKTYRWTGSVYTEISATAASTWGAITGTLSNQTDLQTALNAKQNSLGYTPVPETRTLTINGTTQDLSADRTFTISTGITIGTTAIASGTVGRVLFEGTGNVVQESANLFWDNTNVRLGVGTSSPAHPIDARGLNEIIKITATGGGATIKYQNSFGSTWNVGSTGNDFYWLYNGVSSFMTLKNNGNVLINTSTDAGFRLDVNGTARVQGALTTSAGIISNGTVRVTATTASPSGNASFFVFDGAEGTNFAYDYGTATYRALAYNGSLVRFLTGGTERARFAITTGNFLINTTTDAGFRLDVNGTARFNASSGNDIITDATNVTLNGYASSGSVIRFQSRNAAAALLYKLTIPNNTNTAAIFNGGLRFTNLPTSSAGLSAGDIWNDAGTLKIV